jgi:hypothetical protein
VNDQPVANVAEFKKLVTNPGELRLSLKRMTKGRIVTIRDTGGNSQPAEKKDKEPETKPE